MSSTDAPYDVVVEHDVPMETRDGTVLRADVYRPDAEGTFPVLVVRTAYDKSVRFTPEGKPAVHVSETHFFPQHGYVVVAQDTRGRYASDGEFTPFFDEALDGYDTVEWAARLPWSDGRVVTCGQSYQAITQYLTAPLQPPSLRAMSVVSAPVSFFENCVYRNGVFELGWMLPYFLGLSYDTLERKGLDLRPALEAYLEDPSVRFSPLKREHYEHLPISDWGERLAPGAPYFADLLAHSVDGPFWDRTDVLSRAAEIDTPTLHVGSWYDSFQPDGQRMFRAMRDGAPSAAARRGQKLIMGPWGHIPYSHPTTQGAGEAEFGPEALIDLHAIQLRYFDHLLKGVDTGLLDEPPVRIFVMGENVWRDEQEWPLARTRYTPLYLHSGGAANSVRGDGTLSFDAPAGDEPADGFTYDPHDPVPTRGGTTLMALGMAGGVFDQREIEEREDVLVYTSDALEADLEVTGPVTMTLFAASTAPDTDFTAKLVDVRPDGYAANVVDGVVRARFRDSLRAPTPIEPGAVVEYAIDLWATSHLFRAGHRLRLEVSSSNFPRYDRNANTGAPFGTDTELRTAEQTIHHDAARPSAVVLPVIPR